MVWSKDIRDRAVAARRRNTGSGHPSGIYFHKASAKWHLRVGKQYIGLFATREEAIAVRLRILSANGEDAGDLGDEVADKKKPEVRVRLRTKCTPAQAAGLAAIKKEQPEEKKPEPKNLMYKATYRGIYLGLYETRELAEAAVSEAQAQDPLQEGSPVAPRRKSAADGERLKALLGLAQGRAKREPSSPAQALPQAPPAQRKGRGRPSKFQRSPKAKAKKRELDERETPRAEPKAKRRKLTDRAPRDSRPRPGSDSLLRHVLRAAIERHSPEELALPYGVTEIRDGFRAAFRGKFLGSTKSKDVAEQMVMQHAAATGWKIVRILCGIRRAKSRTHPWTVWYNRQYLGACATEDDGLRTLLEVAATNGDERPLDGWKLVPIAEAAQDWITIPSDSPPLIATEIVDWLEKGLVEGENGADVGAAPEPVEPPARTKEAKASAASSSSAAAAAPPEPRASGGAAASAAAPGVRTRAMAAAPHEALPVNPDTVDETDDLPPGWTSCWKGMTDKVRRRCFVSPDGDVMWSKAEVLEFVRTGQQPNAAGAPASQKEHSPSTAPLQVDDSTFGCKVAAAGMDLCPDIQQDVAADPASATAGEDASATLPEEAPAMSA